VYTHTLTRELVAPEVKHHQFNTFPKCIWDWTCQKKYLEKNEAKIYTSHTLTRDFVALKRKILQIDTIAQ
jgi:hypothetical protein